MCNDTSPAKSFSSLCSSFISWIKRNFHTVCVSNGWANSSWSVMQWKEKKTCRTRTKRAILHHYLELVESFTFASVTRRRISDCSRRMRINVFTVLWESRFDVGREGKSFQSNVISRKYWRRATAMFSFGTRRRKKVGKWIKVDEKGFFKLSTGKRNRNYDRPSVSCVTISWSVI